MRRTDEHGRVRIKARFAVVATLIGGGAFFPVMAVWAASSGGLYERDDPFGPLKEVAFGLLSLAILAAGLRLALRWEYRVGPEGIEVNRGTFRPDERIRWSDIVRLLPGYTETGSSRYVRAGLVWGWQIAVRSGVEGGERRVRLPGSLISRRSALFMAECLAQHVAHHGDAWNPLHASRGGRPRAP